MQGLKLDCEYLDNYVSLHSDTCCESEEDFDLMTGILLRDRDVLERAQMPFLSTPLRDAAARGHARCVRFLLSRGARVASEDRRGSSPLDAAVTAGSLDSVLALLRAGADPNRKSASNPSVSATHCLNRACVAGFTGIVEVLLQHGALTEDLPQVAPDFLLATPASLAVTYGHHAILRLLLLHGAAVDLSTLEMFANRPELVNKHSLVQLCVAQYPRNNLEVTGVTLRILREFGADFHRRDVKGHTALECLQDKKDSQDVQTMLENLISEPMTLMELSRLTLWKFLARNYINVIDKLDIPSSLIDFLHF